MAQQTAVEWFFKWFNDNPEATHKEYAEAFEQAKQMEKKQIEDAYNEGDRNATGKSYGHGKLYYDETYKNK